MASEGLCGRCGWRGRGCTAARCAELTQGPGEVWAGVVRTADEVGGCVVLYSSAACCVGCGVRLTAAELQDEGRDECGPCTERGARWSAAPSPAECVGDEARAELQALAEVLNQTRPIVDAVPFTLRGEARKDDGARQPRIF